MTYPLGQRFESAILTACGSSGLEVVEIIQELWSGYGKILRIRLSGGSRISAIAKHVRLPKGGTHPRGWNTDHSHQRKLKSYQVETTWYRDWSRQCGDTCRIPRLLACDRDGDEILLVLEDLDEAGYPARLHGLDRQQIDSCLAWLANFHATFLGAAPDGLWKTGTYWHLDTRGDELDALDDLPLKQAAADIDAKLNQATYQTIVHGDAKLANFCFSPDGRKVAAVDFQYVGGGCGMKDVAYFLGSCLDESACEKQESELLDRYFHHLRQALAEKQPNSDAAAIESEWRTLFPLAWTDFHRFLKGWSPGHWKINSYSERMARKVVGELKNR
ncbi:phosphotransferase [Haloferula sp.]|uniref:phosphotransferase n=1 Tax=Haloferula sp. TaxID=2497595 RepID=UPI003C71D683